MARISSVLIGILVLAAGTFGQFGDLETLVSPECIQVFVANIALLTQCQQEIALIQHQDAATCPVIADSTVCVEALSAATEITTNGCFCGLSTADFVCTDELVSLNAAFEEAGLLANCGAAGPEAAVDGGECTMLYETLKGELNTTESCLNVTNALDTAITRNLTSFCPDGVSLQACLTEVQDASLALGTSGCVCDADFLQSTITDIFSPSNISAITANATVCSMDGSSPEFLAITAAYTEYCVGNQTVTNLVGILDSLNITNILDL